MLVRKSQSKKKSTAGLSTGLPLDSSLTSIEWLPKMQIGENPLPPSTTISTPPIPQPSSVSTSTTLPITLSKTNPLPKTEPHEIELPTSSAIHLKPPYSYVTLIRQAIMSASLQRMTLNEIYQWIIDSYPYFRTAPPKWKNSIRHNLSLNKCFKRLQRSTNDPGKGSYWAVEESHETSPSNSRKRRFEDIPPSLHVLPSSPTTHHHHPTAFYTNNNPMIYDVGSICGQSSSADESDSTMSLAAHTSLNQWDDLNLDLTASFRRFREQILEGPSTNWINPSDAPTTSAAASTAWGHDLFPHGETNSFFESVKLASSGEINWHDIDVKPYCEFLDGFRTNSSFQQQDRDKLINLASSLSSFFDHTGITHLAQNKITNDPMVSNRYPGISNRMIVESTNNLSSLPVVVEDEAFDWDSIT